MLFTRTHRTYPNLVQVSGIRGDSFEDPQPVSLVLPFTRLMVGPADYAFSYKPSSLQQTGKTLTYQLALSVIFFSPVTTLFWYAALFLPYSCLRHSTSHSNRDQGPPTLKDIMQDRSKHAHITFWSDLPTTWDSTLVISSSVGQWICLARKTSQGIWYLASASTIYQNFVINLQFLDDGVSYNVKRYQDFEESAFESGITTTGTSLKGDPYSITLFKGGADVAVFIPEGLEQPVRTTKISYSFFPLKLPPFFTLFPLLLILGSPSFL